MNSDRRIFFSDIGQTYGGIKLDITRSKNSQDRSGGILVHGVRSNDPPRQYKVRHVGLRGERREYNECGGPYLPDEPVRVDNTASSAT